MGLVDRVHRLRAKRGMALLSLVLAFGSVAFTHCHIWFLSFTTSTSVLSAFRRKEEMANESSVCSR